MSHPKTKLVACKKCSKSWMMRSDGFSKYKGLCRSCATTTQMIGNTFNKGKHLSSIHKLHISISGKGKQAGLRHPMFGKTHSQETRKKISHGVLVSFTPEVKIKMSTAHKGEKSSTWKGGVTPQNELIRRSSTYRIWRKAVFGRDNFACIFGGKEHGNRLHADHIKPFAVYPELRFAIDNGRTLCENCHRKTDTYGRKKPQFILMK